LRIFKTKWFARFARKEGISGGYRTIIVYKVKTLAVFVYGFPKSSKANLGAIELDAYKKLAQVFLGFNDQDTVKALSAGELKEVDTHDQEI
jgi:hypothetical protein